MARDRAFAIGSLVAVVAVASAGGLGANFGFLHLAQPRSPLGHLLPVTDPRVSPVVATPSADDD